MTDRVILLVDDEKTILDSLKQQLRHLFGDRFVYETAEDVPEAWEVLDDLNEAGARVVLIVSDWLMPGVRGDEFLTEVRRKHPGIMRVLLTGQADEDALQRAREKAEVLRIIHKPWTKDDLRAVISAAAD